MYLFMTGYPGFIATRLLRELVKKTTYARIDLLVQDTADQRFVRQAQAAVASDLADLPIRIIPGDITKPDLGIQDPAILAQLKSEAGDWWHLAAVYRLDVPAALAHQVNVEGTRHILALARQCPELRRLHYISTAYVSGDRMGPVLEEELDMPGQGFKNHYESTKHEAEALVRAAMPSLPTTIYRFAVVVGDSRTGETAKFDGPYFLLRFLDRWGRWLVPQVGPMQTRFNMVPVDFVVAAAAAIARRSDTVGQTFHIVDPAPKTAREVMARLSEAMGCRRPRPQIPQRLFFLLARLRWVRRLLGLPAEAVLYMNHGADYDTRQAHAVLEAEGIVCPPLESYLPRLVAWYKENRNRPELQVPVN